MPLFPHMLKLLCTDKDKVIIPYFLDTVTDDPPHSCTVLDEVQFELFMLMQRIGKLRFMAFHYMETVFFRQRADFGENFSHTIRFGLLIY